MRISDDLKLFYECTLGRKSHINLAGKILFFPVIATAIFTYAVLDILFTKRQ